jgi:tetratricopeptide (TPR) repeat protein
MITDRATEDKEINDISEIVRHLISTGNTACAVDTNQRIVDLGTHYELQINDTNRAIELYGIALNNCPDDDRCLDSIGLYYMTVENDYREAEKYFMRSAQLGNQRARYNMGQLKEAIGVGQYNVGLPEEAKGFERSAVYWYSESQLGRAKYNLGLIHLSNHRVDEAIQCFRQYDLGGDARYHDLDALVELINIYTTDERFDVYTLIHYLKLYEEATMCVHRFSQKDPVFRRMIQTIDAKFCSRPVDNIYKCLERNHTLHLFHAFDIKYKNNITLDNSIAL